MKNYPKQYHLVSDQTGKLLKTETFTPEIFKNIIVSHLINFPNAMVEYYIINPQSKKMYDLLDFYENNPKTGKPCKCIFKGQKQYYRELTIN